MPDLTPDGREIITREPAYMETAFGKKLDPPKLVKGITRALLADDSTVYLCDRNDYQNNDLQPVIRHLSKHAPSSRKYTPEQQAAILKFRDMEHAKGRNGWAERVAARLNKDDKIKRSDGTPWLAHHVASLTRQWMASDDHDPISALPAEAPAMSNRDRAILIATNLSQARKLLEEIAELEAVFGCDHDDYDHLRDKARKYDSLKSLMRE